MSDYEQQSPPRDWLTTTEAAEFLQVSLPTVSDYVATGHLSRQTMRTDRGVIYYLYNRHELAAFDARFPVQMNGRRKAIGVESRVERNVSRRVCTDGRKRYIARYIDPTGKQRTRTFATLDAARRWRDRMEAQRDQKAGTAAESAPPSLTWYARIKSRFVRRPQQVTA